MGGAAPRSSPARAGRAPAPRRLTRRATRPGGRAATVDGLMRVAEPAPNVELRDDRHGHAHVVFSFPYRADIVDAVRAIPGRRFDWDAKEWWAPQADATAPYVKGVIERYPSLLVADPVTAWLSRGDVGLGRPGRRRAAARQGRVRARDDRRRAAGRAGRRSPRTPAGGCGSPFSQATGRGAARAARRAARQAGAALRDEAPDRPGARPGDARARRQRRRGALHARRQLGSRHDPRPSSPCPACEAHGRSLPLDPYLVEPLEHYLRTHGVEVAANAGDVLARLRVEHDEAIEHVRRSRAHDARGAGHRGPARRRAAPVPARGRRLRAARRGGRSWPTSRASARPSRRSPRSRRTTPTPR